MHRFIENAATAGASRGTGAEGTVADVQAQLRKQFRQQMSVGAWKDLHTHILRRVAHINPTPAAEAKMLREKVDQNRCFREKRVAVARRRLDEGEALGGRATAGRGRASGESSARAMLWGSTAASDAGLVVSGGGGRWSGNGDGSGRESACAGAGQERAPRGSGGGFTDVMSSDLSPTGGRLRTENLHFAPSHLTTQSNRSSRGGGCSSKSSGGAGGAGGGSGSGDSGSGSGQEGRVMGRVRERVNAIEARAGGDGLGSGRAGGAGSGEGGAGMGRQGQDGGGPHTHGSLPEGGGSTSGR